MEKISFLTRVAEVMKGMISHDTMMAAIQRSCMRGEVENLKLMEREEDRVDRLIVEATAAEILDIPDAMIDIIVLRYLKNTQFLATIEEDDIDVTGLEGGDLSYWKKTLLFRAP